MIKSTILAAFIATSVALPAAAQSNLSIDKLHRFVSGHMSWNTNSYWIEGENGVALVDAQLIPSDAKRLGEQIKATGKPLSGVIITHPHPDHIGGLATLRDMFGDFPIYASQVSSDHFEQGHQMGIANNPMPNRFNEALDDRLVKATHIVENGQTVSIAGISFEIHDLGAGEAVNNIVAYQKDLDLVFAGDTFYPYAHYYVGEGHIDGALDHLNFLKTTYPAETYVLSGHSNPARMASIDLQIEYIDDLVEAVRKAREDKDALDENGRLSRDARGKMVDELMMKYASYEDFGFGSRTVLAWNSYGVESWLMAKK